MRRASSSSRALSLVPVLITAANKDEDSNQTGVFAACGKASVCLHTCVCATYSSARREYLTAEIQCLSLISDSQ